MKVPLMIGPPVLEAPRLQLHPLELSDTLPCSRLNEKLHAPLPSKEFNVEINGENRIDIDFGGKLDSDDMKATLEELAVKAKDIKNGKMLYCIGDFDLPILGAIGVELSRLPELFKLIEKFDRVAVLANQNWVLADSKIEGYLISGLEIRAFEPDKASEAEAWLSS